MATYHQFVHYTESPVTDDERQIAVIMEMAADAINNKDAKLFLSLLWDDATAWMTPTSTAISKREYGEAIYRIVKKIRRISYKDVFIRLGSPDRAYVYCLSYLIEENAGLPHKTERCFAFTKRNGRWGIADITYFIPSAIQRTLGPVMFPVSK